MRVGSDGHHGATAWIGRVRGVLEFTPHLRRPTGRQRLHFASEIRRKSGDAGVRASEYFVVAVGDNALTALREVVLRRSSAT